MNTNKSITPTERDAVLMVNSYGIEVAIKVAKNQVKFYQSNKTEWEYWTRVVGQLLGIQTKKFAS